MATASSIPKVEPDHELNQSKTTNYLGSFKRLGPQIYFYHPILDNASYDGATTATLPRPDIIIVCAWMAASPKHIAKYTDNYLTRYPAIPVLLLTCTVSDVMLKSNQDQLDDIKPAITAVQSVFGSINNSPRVLLHIFSNGGIWSAGMLATAYENTTGGLALPVSALVLDSCPSLPHMRLSHRALSAALPNISVIQFVGGLFIWLVLAIIRVVNFLQLSENVILKLRQVLNNPMGPFIKGGIPRVYIGSKTDAMVPFEDIKLHANESRAIMKQSGVKEADVQTRVVVEEFEGSAHVGHLVVDKDRYWKVVRNAWAEAMKAREQKLNVDVAL